MSDPAGRRGHDDDEQKESAGDQQEQEVGGHPDLVVGHKLLRNFWRTSGTCGWTSVTCRIRSCCWSSEVVNGDHIRKVGGRIGNKGLPGFNNLIISGFEI